jgi:hypothetical protein
MRGKTLPGGGSGSRSPLERICSTVSDAISSHVLRYGLVVLSNRVPLPLSSLLPQRTNSPSTYKIMQLEDTIMNDAELELPTLPTISSSISTESMMETCATLSELIQPEKNLPDNVLLSCLYNSVQTMLRDDEKIQVAPRNEFLRKVKDYPEDVFISKVKDTAKAGQEAVTSWGVLFNEGVYSFLFFLQCSNHLPYLDVFYCDRENRNQNMYVTEGSVRGAQAILTSPYLW